MEVVISSAGSIKAEVFPLHDYLLNKKPGINMTSDDFDYPSYPDKENPKIKPLKEEDSWDEGFLGAKVKPEKPRKAPTAPIAKPPIRNKARGCIRNIALIFLVMFSVLLIDWILVNFVIR
jgi:hypothetical protein